MATTGRDAGSSAIAASFSPEVNVVNTLMLRRYRGSFIYQQFASPEVGSTLPGNAGTDTLQFNRINSLDVKTTVNTDTAATPQLDVTKTPEAVNVEPDAITKFTVRAKVNQYSRAVAWSDRLQAESIFSLPMEVRELLMENHMETMDAIVQAAISLRRGATGETNNVLTQVINVGQTATNAITSSNAFATTALDQAMTTLRANKVPLWKPPVNPTDAVNTQPLMASYVCIASPAQAAIIAGSNNFLAIEKYASPQFMTQITNGNVYFTEVGAYRSGINTCRIFVTENKYALTDAGASNTDIGTTHVFGMGFYGMQDTENQRHQVIFVPNADSGNIIRNRYFLSWKATTAVSIANSSNGVCIFSATV